MSSRLHPWRRLCQALACAAVVVAASLAGAALEARAAVVPATRASIAKAQPLKPFLSGASEREPKLCDGVTTSIREILKGSDNTGSMEVSPASTEAANLSPGTSYSHCFLVHNRQQTVQRFTISVVELTGSPDPDQQLELVEDPQTLGTWIHPGELELELRPAERIAIPYTIDLPGQLPAGTAIAAIRVTLEPPPSDNASGAQVRPSLLQRIYLTFPGGQAKQLEVSNVRAPSVLSRSKREITYTSRFTVTNRGTVIDSFRTKLEIRGLGRKVGSVSTGTVTTLPNGAVRITQEWDDVPWIGFYTPVATVQSREGDIKVKLPRLLVLPPRGYLLAIIAAVLTPILVLLWRWRRRRAEWLAYLEEEDDEDGFGDEFHDQYGTAH